MTMKAMKAIKEINSNSCLVTANNFLDEDVELVINTSFEKLCQWMYNSEQLPLIQDYFPELSTNEREFLLSGMTSETWDNLFGEDDGFFSSNTGNI